MEAAACRRTAPKVEQREYRAAVPEPRLRANRGIRPTRGRIYRQRQNGWPEGSL
jgi:hypothetical protein